MLQYLVINVNNTENYLDRYQNKDRIVSYHVFTATVWQSVQRFKSKICFYFYI